CWLSSGAASGSSGALTGASLGALGSALASVDAGAACVGGTRTGTGSGVRTAGGSWLGAFVEGRAHPAQRPVPRLTRISQRCISAETVTATGRLASPNALLGCFGALGLQNLAL